MNSEKMLKTIEKLNLSDLSDKIDNYSLELGIPKNYIVMILKQLHKLNKVSHDIEWKKRLSIRAEIFKPIEKIATFYGFRCWYERRFPQNDHLTDFELIFRDENDNEIVVFL